MIGTCQIAMEWDCRTHSQRKAKFSMPEAISLLYCMDIQLVED
ncbi:hypothetical protein [Brevibacillus sp. AY1]|nr:hypothetical protein [Brevibacillus sp. AY1]